MVIKHLLLIFIFCLYVGNLAFATTIESATSGTWSVGTTWVGGIVPTAGDDVVIKNNHVVTLSGPHSCALLTIDVGGTFTLISSLTTSGGLTNNGTISWTSGTFIGSGVITNNGTLNLSTQSTHNTESNILNNGTLNWTEGYLDQSVGGQVLTNTGTFNFNSINQTCEMSIINSGLMQRTQPGIFNLTKPLDNQSSGTVIVSSGCSITIQTGNITQSGTFTIDGTLTFNGGTHTLNVANSFSGTGTISISGPPTINGAAWSPAIPTITHTSTLNGSVTLSIPSGTTWNWTSGIFALTNPITNNGILNLSTQSTHNTASNITNNGTLNWTEGYLDQSVGGQVLTNTGTFNFNSINQTCEMSIVNLGTMQRTQPGTFNLTRPLDNLANGTVIIASGCSFTTNGGNITQSGTFTNNGTLNFSAGTNIINVPGSFSGTGTINFLGNTVMNGSSWAPAIPTVTHSSTLSGTAALTIPSGTTWNWTTGTFELTGTITNNGIMNISTSSQSHNTTSNITNNGTLNWTEGYLDQSAGGQVLTNTGTFNFNSISQTCEMSIVNSGTMQRTQPGTFNLTKPLENLANGIVIIASGCSFTTNGGNITQSGTFTINGTLNFSAGTNIINVPGSFSGTGTINIIGNIIMDGSSWAPAIPIITHASALSGTAALTIPSGTTWNWTNGTFALTSPITNNGILNIPTPSQTHNTASNITNNGTLNWTDGYLDLSAGGQVLTNTGTFNFNSISQTCEMSIVNSGTMQRTQPGTFNLTKPLENLANGILIIASGCSFTTNGGNITQSGTFTINGTLNFSAGTNIINVPGSFSGTGTINIIGNIIMDGSSWAPAIPIITHASALSGTAALTIPSGTTWNWTNGTFALTSPITNNGILNISNPSFHNTESNIFNNGTLNWTDGYLDLSAGGQVLTNNGTFNFNATGYNCNMPIVNSGTFQKSSTGTSTVTTAYTGNSGGYVNLQDGMLKFNSSFNNNGTIKGVAAINLSSATVTSFGGVSPGNSPGTLTLTGNYTNSALSIEIDYSGGMVTKDSLYVSGNITLGGSLVVSQTGNVPSGNYVFLKSGGTMTGTFSSVTLPDCYTIEYGATTVTLKKGIAKVWDGTVNQWDEPTHWNPNGVPCPYDDVIINSGICELNINPDMKSLTINGGSLKKVDAATYAINVPIVVASPGFINVFAGTLDINSTLDNNGTIQGYANIDLIGATVIGGYGKYAPGNSIGELTTKGMYNNEVIEMEIGGNGGGFGTIELDKLVVSQTMDIAGTLDLLWIGGTIPPGNRVLMECQGGGICRTGIFATINLPPQCPPGKCNIIYTDTEVRLENTEPIEFTGTCTWLGGTGNWSTVAKWSCNDVPNFNDDVVVNSGTVTVDNPTTVKTLNLGGNATLTGDKLFTISNVFNWSGGELAINNTITTGAANISGSGSVSSGNLVLSQGGTLTNAALMLKNQASLTIPATKILDLNYSTNGLFRYLVQLRLPTTEHSTK